MVTHTLLRSRRTLVTEAVATTVGTVGIIAPGVVRATGVAVLKLGAITLLRTRRAIVTVTVATTVGTGLHILAVSVVTLVEVSADTSLLCARAGTLTSGAGERTVFAVDPSVVQTGINLIAHTLGSTVGTVLVALTIATDVGHARAVTTVQFTDGPLGSTVVAMLRVTIPTTPTTAHTIVATSLTVVTQTTLCVASISTLLVGIRVQASVTVEAVVASTNALVRGRCTVVVGIEHCTSTVTGVVTTTGTLLGIPLVELTVGTTVLRNAIRTGVRIRGTLVTVTVATTILTLLGVNPTVVLAGEDIIADTLGRTIRTGSNTLTVLTNARHVRGVTTVVTARPSMLGAIVFTVTAVAVPSAPACAVTLVGSELTVVTLTRLGVTVVSAT